MHYLLFHRSCVPTLYPKIPQRLRNQVIFLSQMCLDLNITFCNIIRWYFNELGLWFDLGTWHNSNSSDSKIAFYSFTFFQSLACKFLYRISGSVFSRRSFLSSKSELPYQSSCPRFKHSWRVNARRTGVNHFSYCLKFIKWSRHNKLTEVNLNYFSSWMIVSVISFIKIYRNLLEYHWVMKV